MSQLSKAGLQISNILTVTSPPAINITLLVIAMVVCCCCCCCCCCCRRRRRRRRRRRSCVPHQLLLPVMSVLTSQLLLRSISAATMSTREKLAMQKMAWPAVNRISKPGPQLPANGWTGSTNRDIIQQGTFVCSSDPVQQPTTAERNALKT